jgi:lipopolysaccharide export LptBFGC system permease protein LptF
MLGLVDRLVLGVLAPRAGAVLLAGVLIFAAVEVVDLANVAAGEGARSSFMIRYPLRLPLVVVLISPVAALVAGCWTTVHLRRTGQLTALSAAGLAPVRALGSLPVVGLGWALAVWSLAEVVAPIGLEAWSGGATRPRGAGWVRSGDVLSRGTPHDPDVVLDVLVFTLDPRGLPEQRIEAARAERRGRGWELVDARVTARGERPTSAERLAAPGPLLSSGSRASPQELTGPELDRASREARATGVDDAPLTAERGLRAALAVACFLCLVLGAAAGVRFGSTPGRAAAAVAVIGVFYWLALSSCWTLATTGRIAGWAVAVVPSAILAVPALLEWGRIRVPIPPRLCCM